MKYAKPGLWIATTQKEMEEFLSFRPNGKPVSTEKQYPPDHTDPIWDDQYEVIVPTLATKSVTSLNRLGLPKTGIKHIDEFVPKIENRVYLSINDIVEIYDRGYKIKYTSPQSVVNVWMACYNYLEFWRQRESINENELHAISTAPKRDLELISSYMDSIYPLIKEHVENDEVTLTDEVSKLLFGGTFDLGLSTMVKPAIKQVDFEDGDDEPLSFL